MKTVMRIGVFIEKQDDDKENIRTPRSLAAFHVDSDIFYDEQQIRHFALSITPLIASAMLDFEIENTPTKDEQEQAKQQQDAIRKVIDKTRGE